VIDAEALAKRARRRWAALARARRDPRYRRVLGRYVAAGVLSTTEDVNPHRSRIEIADALWAGRVEPRILVLLPALIVKRPSLFVDVDHLPDDLRAAVTAMRKNQQPDEFRSIPGAALLRWLPAVGHRNKLPSRLKSFRMQVQDLDLLDRLSEKLGVSQTNVVRRALRELADQTLQ
jgi:hypothetical protein